MTDYFDDDDELLPSNRFWVYMLLIVLAMGTFFARTAHVRGTDKQTPFLSANDRSRWCTVQSLVEDQTYEIDDVIQRRGWDSIDKVSHRGRDGQRHYYSSKPPIIAWVLAQETRLVELVSGKKLAKAPFYVGRTVVIITNGVLLLILFATVWLAVERWGETDNGRVFVMACATFGTLLTTFSNSINNHLPGAVATGVAMYVLLRIWYDDQLEGWRFGLAGFAAASAAACELPAVSLLVGVVAALLIKSPKQMLLFSLPAIGLVATAYFGTNYQAHQSWRPPYAHRIEGQDWQGDNWYKYDGSYWSEEGMKKGFDVGEENVGVYAFHVIAGHHGILSLTPIWILSIWGTFHWLFQRQRIAMGLAVVGLTATCLVFFILMRPLMDRNYGGSCCGFRWMFWLIPLWLFAMIPAADWFANRRFGQVIVAIALAVSVFSATYPLLNPWTHPWLWAYWKNLGWI